MRCGAAEREGERERESGVEKRARIFTLKRAAYKIIETRVALAI